MIRSTILAAVTTLSFLSPLAAQETPSAGKTIVILDASGSMWGQIEGRPKIEIAREAIAGLLATLDPATELGLMAYGHREKGNCDDIELLVPPGKVDRAAFLEKVNGIMPKGMTPLTDAVEQAAGYLMIEENAANVILVSDGLETCDRDPCVLAGELAAKGIAFRTHIVAFDLTSDEAATIKCLADETGGAFLQAQDAATLKDALELAVEASSQAMAEMPAPKLDPATLSAPATVPAGSKFEATWEGPDNPGDYLTIVAKTAEDGKYGNYAYTRNGSPAELTAPVEPGLCEVRYMASPGGEVLGRVDIEVVPVEATLKAPAEAVAGSSVAVEWTGPANDGDYLTIVPAGAEEGSYKGYAYTRDGSPAKVRALPDPGAAELRYVTGQGAKTLAFVPIQITKAEVAVAPPEAADAGEEIVVAFTGPNNEGDFLTIVLASAEEGASPNYAYTRDAVDGAVSLKAPEEAGDGYEVRYVSGAGSATLARAPIVVRPVTATVSGPEKAVAGSEVEVTWFGPRYPGWYVTIVAASADEGAYGRYFYTADVEGPAKVQAPAEPGPAEIRFMSQGGRIFAKAPIEIVAE